MKQEKFIIQGSRIRLIRNYLLVIAIMVITNETSFSQTPRSVEDTKGIKVGIEAPLFTAVDADSNKFILSDALQTNPIVLIFYRGFWCPICNKHLSNIQDSLKLIIEKGATVIAISPEKPEYLQKMAGKSGAQFKLLYDDGYKISDAYNVTFTPEAKQLFVYNTILNGKLKESHSDDSQRLPIPATYIIGMDGKVHWRQLDPNYKNRSSVREILENLPHLK